MTDANEALQDEELDERFRDLCDKLLGIGAGLAAGSTFDVADALQEFAKEVECDPTIN